jgi:hypothetical protein
MELDRASGAAALPRKQERRRSRSRVGGRLVSVPSGRLKLGYADARKQARLSDKPRVVLKAPNCGCDRAGQRSELRVRAEPCRHVRPTVVEMHSETTTGRLSRQPQAKAVARPAARQPSSAPLRCMDRTSRGRRGRRAGSRRQEQRARGATAQDGRVMMPALVGGADLCEASTHAIGGRGSAGRRARTAQAVSPRPLDATRA